MQEKNPATTNPVIGTDEKIQNKETSNSTTKSSIKNTLTDNETKNDTESDSDGECPVMYKKHRPTMVVILSHIKSKRKYGNINTLIFLNYYTHTAITNLTLYHLTPQA